jgi:pimeloyl-ACP methyl ester carboxylesterase
LGLAAASSLGALWLFQGRLIYPAPHYSARQLSSLPPELVVLRDPVDNASIVGFYRAAPGASVPKKLWLLFGGNGDSALRWDALIAPSVTADTAFLLVEYPGYGARAGEPSPESLLSGTEQTLAALSRHLGASQSELLPRIALVGYSLGAAAALEFAVKHPVRRIVLFSPFTSMLDMARRSVGSPLCYLLRHRYDNVTALERLKTHGVPPLSILHGERDSFIPHQMGEALAAQVPGGHFELVPGAEHGDVIDIAVARLAELLAEP